MLTAEEYAQLPYEERYPDHVAVLNPNSPEWEAYIIKQYDAEDMRLGWCRYFGPRTSIRYPGLRIQEEGS